MKTRSVPKRRYSGEDFMLLNKKTIVIEPKTAEEKAELVKMKSEVNKRLFIQFGSKRVGKQQFAMRSVAH